MLETLTTGFKNARDRLTGAKNLSEGNVSEALRNVRMSLLEADVDFEVVKDFLERVKSRSLGEKVETRIRDSSGRLRKVTPGQHFIAICQEELIDLMGPTGAELKSKKGVISILLAGLQGVGKTTVAGKLARHLKEEGRYPLLVAADTYRPAAAEQLVTLGKSIDVAVHVGSKDQTPVDICGEAEQRLETENFDSILYDTAGRTVLDADMMSEIQEISTTVSPSETLFVCDSLMGRDAVNVAKAFHESLPLDGLILTKLDGDARGGAALAIKSVTGVPIKFLSTGETLDKLESFRPEGIASRILGMGDIVGLVQDFEAVVDADKAEQEAERLLSGNFGMDDLLKQLRTIQKMGSIKEVLGKLPMMGGMADQVDPKELLKVESIIQSMTVQERKSPEVIETSRANRIAKGCGRTSKDVTSLIQRFNQMRDFMSQMGSGKGPFGKLSGAMGGGGSLPFDQSLIGAAAPKNVKAEAKRRQAQKRKRKQSRKDRKKRRKK